MCIRDSHLAATSRVLKSLTSTVGFRGWVAVCGSGNEMDSLQGNYVTVDTPRSSRSGPVGPHRLCEPRTLHQLRHSRLTHLAEAGVQLPILMAKSRHTSLISLAVYAQPHLRRRRRRHRGTRPRPPALTPSHSRATSPDASRAFHGLLRSPSTRRPSSATTPTPSSSSVRNSMKVSTPPRRST